MTVLIVPGLGGSGPDHWQSIWETELPDARCVPLGEWDAPELELWLAHLDEAVRAAGPDAVLIAHSLGCSLVAHWAAGGGRVRAALLVAPADVDSRLHTPPETWNFAPMPMQRLPFPAMVVASRNDPYVTFARAEELAVAWGGAFRDAGAVGHINAGSGLGAWPEGQAFLQELLRDVPAA